MELASRLWLRIREKSVSIPWFKLLLLSGITLLAVYIRFQMRSFQSGDYDYILSKWYINIQQDGLDAIRHGVTNYSPIYEILLYFVSILFPRLSALGAIKLPSILADFLCAYFAYRIVRTRYPGFFAPTLAYFAVLFAPSMLMNSALWAQADAFYTAGILACIFFILVKKDALACIAFGLAFSFKLQAVFLLPFLAIMVVKKRLSWKPLWLIPAVFFITFLPAWIIGRPLGDIIGIYHRQIDIYQNLWMGAPNFYIWLPDKYFDLLVPVGVTLTASLCFIFVAVAYHSKAEITDSLVLGMAFLSAVFVPFFLPKMHERYFFVADVVSILFVFFLPRFYYLAVTMNLISMLVYLPYLFKIPTFSYGAMAIVLFVLIVLLAKGILLRLYPQMRARFSRETVNE